MAEKQISHPPGRQGHGVQDDRARSTSSSGKLGDRRRPGRAGASARSAGNLAKIGVPCAAVGIGVAVKNGIDSLVELESAVTNVDGAIAQLGPHGQGRRAAQVATWANEIEASMQAAFDDKEITAGARGT